ncbi:hypothetical protein PLICRDRAFT_610580 [Plicaturopsis crispa FD-325 SS-3]|nr:hypothetical protein PLICRDRAFT_610580 [Plicaturopsis crispa FD-325 SS-3]
MNASTRVYSLQSRSSTTLRDLHAYRCVPSSSRASSEMIPTSRILFLFEAIRLQDDNPQLFMFLQHDACHTNGRVNERTDLRMHGYRLAQTLKTREGEKERREEWWVLAYSSIDPVRAYAAVSPRNDTDALGDGCSWAGRRPPTLKIPKDPTRMRPREEDVQCIQRWDADNSCAESRARHPPRLAIIALRTVAISAYSDIVRNKHPPNYIVDVNASESIPPWKVQTHA